MIHRFGTVELPTKTAVRVLVVALAVTAQVAAQESERPRISLEARVGYARPTGDLGRADAYVGGYVAFERVRAGPALGAGLDIRVAGPFHVRLRADYAAEAAVEGQWFCDAFTPCPAVLILVDGRVRSWSLGGEIHYRPRFARWPIEPTVFVGTGRHARRLRWPSPVPEVPIPTSYDRTSTFLRTGVGASRTVGPASLFVELEALFDSFGTERPLFIEGVVPPDELGPPDGLADLGAAVGLRIRIR